MKIASILFYFIIVINSSIARAQDDSIIFGDVELGKALKVEKCTKKYELYSSTKNNCFDGRVGDDIYLHFPKQERPNWLQWGQYAEYAVEIKLFNEIVGSVRMTTSGVNVQDEVLQILKNKYGNPDINKFTEKSNAYGAKMNSITAYWTKDNIVVYFSGITSVN